MPSVSKYLSPARKRAIVRQRKDRRKNKRDRRDKQPSWVKALQSKYDPDSDKNKNKKIAGKRRQRGEGDDDAEDRLMIDPEDDDALEVESDVDEEKIENLNKQTPLERQLFLRGVPSEADEQALKTYFDQYGTVKKVLVVQNKVTKRPSGSAFIHFEEESAAEKAFNFGLKNAQEATADVRHEDESATEGMTHTQAKRLMYKIKQDRFTNKDPFITVMNTRVTVMRPLNRSEAQDMTAGGKSKKERRTTVGLDDPRNLYLLEEGVIRPGTRAADDLHPKYLEGLLRDYETRKQQLRNVNLFVSRTRLSIRNIPRNVTEKQLRALFIGQVKDLLKSNPQLKDKTLWARHGPIKQLRILVDRSGTSRGYGFVEFVKHEYALHCLRHSNNNPTLFGAAHRLVVAFAIENINAIQKLERLKELRKEKMEHAKRSGFVDRPEDDVDPVVQAALKVEQIKKKKEMSLKKMKDAAAPYLNDDEEIDLGDDDDNNNDNSDDDNDNDNDVSGEMKKPHNSADASSSSKKSKKKNQAEELKSVSAANTKNLSENSTSLLSTSRPGVLLTASQQAEEKKKIEDDKENAKSAKAKKVAAERKRKFILQNRKKHGKKG